MVFSSSRTWAGSRPSAWLGGVSSRFDGVEVSVAAEGSGGSSLHTYSSAAVALLSPPCCQATHGERSSSSASSCDSTVPLKRSLFNHASSSSPNAVLPLLPDATCVRFPPQFSPACPPRCCLLPASVVARVVIWAHTACYLSFSLLLLLSCRALSLSLSAAPSSSFSFHLNPPAFSLTVRGIRERQRGREGRGSEGGEARAEGDQRDRVCVCVCTM